MLGRHTLAARKPLSSYNDKGKPEHRELFGCLSVCHTLPTLSQDPSDTGYLLTLRLPDGSNLPPPPPSLPPPRNPPSVRCQGDGLRRRLHSPNLSRVSLTSSASGISACQHQSHQRPQLSPGMSVLTSLSPLQIPNQTPLVL